MLDPAVVDGLFPPDLPDPQHWEQRYPERGLPAGALVTRFAPSPTGFVHIGGVYTAMIAKSVAVASGGSYFVRVEDTDQSREVAGAAEQFARAFEYFGIEPLETEQSSVYGPFLQSRRAEIYLTYVRELLRNDRAYLCFATKEQLAEISAAQNAAKVPTGYYGRWAIWRQASQPDVLDQLAAGTPFVVRFRSPGEAGRRVWYVDGIRGRIEADDNRNDVVILKTSASDLRLPTYHLAHVVDDHLMRVNEVIRGEEWISSVPVHHQLFDALGFGRISYSHIAPLMKQDGGSKRKLSKRKDPEASVDFYLQTGYPAPAVLYYLRGLANGRLAEIPLEQALREPIRLADCGVAGPLVDMVKLADLTRDHIASLDSATVADQVAGWADEYDPELATVIRRDRAQVLRGLDVERVGVDNPRKDLAGWSDFRPAYGFFVPALFTLVTDPTDQRFGGLDPALVLALAGDFVQGYHESDSQSEWFEQIRSLAAAHGFAASAKELKQAPDRYPGSVREAANAIRVLLTGSTRSPDLYAVAMALGSAEVLRRACSLTR